jgi:spore germination protein KA
MNNQRQFENTIRSLEVKSKGFRERTIPYNGGVVKIFFIKQLTDSVSLTENIVKPVVRHINASQSSPKAKIIMENVIFAEESRLENDYSLAEQYLLDGLTVILFSGEREYITVNIKKVEQRQVADPELSYTLRSPRDCFVENLDTNLSLLRYRVKDPSFRAEELTVGQRTKTRVVLSYIDDIIDPNIVRDMRNKINSINIDAIVDSSDIQQILTKKNSLLPQMGIIERSDLAVETLFEGRMVIIVDGSNLVLSVPKVFTEFLYSCDDRYDNKYFALFMRILRYIAFFLSYTGAALYIAIESFHNDILPASYVLSLAQMRSRVPYTALIGVLILEFVTELIREALLRVPKQIGPAIGIVGAIIIGQAAISAGLFTSVLLILMSIEFLASFSIPDFTLMNPFRVIKLFIILMSGLAGFYGLILGLIFVLAKLVSTDSFGIPYMAPFAPLNRYDFKRAFSFNRANSRERQHYAKPKDVKRGG